jgi:NAD(P)-dependent dehydrogenase (short-subunit alcohol dehydrogenase family)
VVTGAARGGGYGAAVALAGQFNCIVLVGRSTTSRPNPLLPGTLEHTRAAVEQRGATGHCVPADLSKPRDRAELIELLLSSDDGCDLLVHSAAYNPIGPFLDSSFGKWTASVTVNLTASAQLCHALAPRMIRRGLGRIINVGSLAAAAEVGLPQLAYATSKAALERFTIGLAVELADHGIAVNNIRVDEAIRSPTFDALITPRDRPQRTTGYSPDAFGAAVAWLAGQPTTFTGNILSFADLRRHGALPPSKPQPEHD